MKKYKHAKSQYKSEDWVMGNKNTNLSAKIPHLAAEMAYSSFKFARQVDQHKHQLKFETGASKTPSNQTAALINYENCHWRDMTLDANEIRTFDCQSPNSYAKQFNRRRERAKGLYLHRKSLGDANQAAKPLVVNERAFTTLQHCDLFEKERDVFFERRTSPVN